MVAAADHGTAARLPGIFTALLSLVMISAMANSPIARISSLQVYTPALIARCLYQLQEPSRPRQRSDLPEARHRLLRRVL